MVDRIALQSSTTGVSLLIDDDEAAVDDDAFTT